MTSKIALLAQTDWSKKKIRVDIYVNVQGDEPLVNSKDIKRIKEKQKFPNEVINAIQKLQKKKIQKHKYTQSNIYKNNRLIYISRQIIPGFKNKKHKPMVYYKQVLYMHFLEANYSLLKIIR